MQSNEAAITSGGEEFQSEAVASLFKELTGITIPLHKGMMIRSRLRKRMLEIGDLSSDSYVQFVRKHPEEQQIFINLLTTNETCFFRTPRVWKYFQETFLPAFSASRPATALRAWSAAASTGEEASSIAMSCLDHALRHPGFRFQILATDVDTNVLARAKRGEFAARTVEKLGAVYPHLAERYFRQQDGDLYKAETVLTHNIRFAIHNLMLRPHTIGLHDIVFLRNVLIYFQAPEQIKILKNVALAMPAGAILVLGESESIAALDTPFVFVEPQIYRRA